MTAAANGAFSLVTTDAVGAAGNIQITADGTVDIDSAGVLTLDSGAAINIDPAAGSAILLDGTISIDAGVVTGATSITSTALVGALTGNASGTAAGLSATLAVASGGTNLTTYAVGDIVYASGTTALSKLTKGAATTVLTMGGSNVPTWAAPAAAGVSVGLTIALG